MSTSYDMNGFMTSSDESGMADVGCNAVGYPSYIELSDGGYVQNTYSAGGVRLGSRRMAPDGEVTAMSYEGNEVLENGSLRMLKFEGGYLYNRNRGVSLYMFISYHRNHFC